MIIAESFLRSLIKVYW